MDERTSLSRLWVLVSGLRDLSKELYMPRSAKAMRRGTVAAPWVENTIRGDDQPKDEELGFRKC